MNSSKKRKLGEFDLPVGLNDSHRELDEDIDTQDQVLVYQKKAIFTQMQEYKSLFGRALDRIQTLESKHSEYDRNIAVIYQYWDQISQELELALPQIQPISSSPSISSLFLKSILNYTAVELADNKIDDYLSKKCSNIRDLIGKLLNGVLERSDSLYNDTTTKNNIDQLQSRCHSYKSRISSLEAENEIKQKRLIEYESRIDNLESLLKRSERKIEKLKLIKIPPPVLVTAESLPVSNSKTQQQQHMMEVEMENPELDLADEFRMQAEMRLKEIQQERAEKLQLQAQIDEFRLQLNTIPEEVCKNSEHYIQLNEQLRKSEESRFELQVLNKQLLQDKTQLEQEKNELISSKDSSKCTLKDSIKSKEEDVARMRGARDQALGELGLIKEKNKLTTTLKQIYEVRDLANSRKDRILALESANTRLKMTLAGGDAELVKYFEENGLNYVRDGNTEVKGKNAAGNPFVDWRNRLSQMEEKLREKEVVIQSFLTASNDILEKQQLIHSQTILKEQITKLEGQLAEIKNLYGHDQDSPGNDQLKVLAKKLSDNQEKVNELTNKIELQQKKEDMYVAEIQSMAEGFQALEEQVTHKVLALVEKEEQILRILAEKTKFDQKCSSLTKQNATLQNHAKSSERIINNYVAEIKKFEERVTSQKFVVTSLEKQLASRTAALEVHKFRVAEHERTREELKEKLSKSDSRLSDAHGILNQRTKILDSELADKKRLEEQIEILKKKIDIYNARNAGSVDESLQKQLDEYRKLLKCTACNNEFKSHIIVRCMHPFCKSCIDNLLESRQRKCPTCGNAFGQQDIKQVFL